MTDAVCMPIVCRLWLAVQQERAGRVLNYNALTAQAY